MNTVNVAVIGLGRMGYWHAENLSTYLRGAELAGVAEKSETKAREVAAQLHCRKWTTDARELFEDPEIDAVVIATPTGSHLELIEAAARQGKHVFVEKPVTHSVQEDERAIQVIEKNGIYCQVGFMRRFDTAFIEAKERIVQGDIGKPIYFKAVSRDPGSPPAEFIKTSGGIFVDMAIHDFDTARFLMGEEIKSVAAHGDVLVHDFMREVPDIDQSLTYLNFESGAAGDIETSRNAAYGYDLWTEVVGTEGSILIGSLKHNDVRIRTSKGSTYQIVPSFPERFKDAYRAELQDFIDRLQADETPKVGAQDGRKALEIAIAAQQSYETGQAVIIPSGKKSVNGR